MKTSLYSSKGELSSTSWGEKYLEFLDIALKIQQCIYLKKKNPSVYSSYEKQIKIMQPLLLKPTEI